MNLSGLRVFDQTYLLRVFVSLFCPVYVFSLVGCWVGVLACVVAGCIFWNLPISRAIGMFQNEEGVLELYRSIEEQERSQVEEMMRIFN